MLAELTATRARLAELEGIAEQLYQHLIIRTVNLPAVRAYEAYKEGKK